MKTYKKWIFSFIAVFLALLLVFGTCNYILDPLVQYGDEGNILKYYKYSELYSNPGIARNYTYDSVLVGTSMSENTDIDECDKLLGSNMVRLPYSGGTAYNMKTILDICFASDNEIKSVYWMLDEFQLTGRSDGPRFPLPEYLYMHDNRPRLEYLLNFDIFYNYTLEDIAATLRGKESKAERRGVTTEGTYSKEAMLATYRRPEIATEKMQFSDIKKNIDKNLNQNMLPLIKENPDTVFTFMMPPYSAVYWDNEIRVGSFDTNMDAAAYAMKRLLAYENVRFFFFQNERDIITNLDNYMDYFHYGKWVNSFMTQSIATGHGQVQPDEVDAVIGDMRSFAQTYDFDAMFE